MGPLRFELRTSAMSRRRHSQLDHEPAYERCSITSVLVLLKISVPFPVLFGQAKEYGILYLPEYPHP